MQTVATVIQSVHAEKGKAVEFGETSEHEFELVGSDHALTAVCDLLGAAEALDGVQAFNVGKSGLAERARVLAVGPLFDAIETKLVGASINLGLIGAIRIGHADAASDHFDVIGIVFEVGDWFLGFRAKWVGVLWRRCRRLETCSLAGRFFRIIDGRPPRWCRSHLTRALAMRRPASSTREADSSNGFVHIEQQRMVRYLPLPNEGPSNRAMRI